MKAEDFEIREALTVEDFQKTVEFQRLIWGDDPTPLPQLIAGANHGGAVLLAVSGDDVLGFSYGFPGCKNGDVYLLSHMLGIHPDHRDRGIGRKLKLAQREWALSEGYRKMVWTFDPLETRNANLNLCKLGGYVKTYIENYYGIMNDRLNFGMPSDRFLLEWDLDSPKALAAIDGSLSMSGWSELPVLYGVTFANDFPVPEESIRLTRSDSCLAPVPADIQAIKSQQFDLAIVWRHRLRSALQAKFQEGYRIEGIVRSVWDRVNAYVLIR